MSFTVPAKRQDKDASDRIESLLKSTETKTAPSQKIHLLSIVDLCSVLVRAQDKAVTGIVNAVISAFSPPTGIGI